MSVIAESLTKIAAAKAAYQEAMKTALDPVLNAIAESGEVSHIVVIGWTPGFNDGEPCEHSADYYVNGDQIHGDELHERCSYLFENAGIDTGLFDDFPYDETDPGYDEALKAMADHRIIWDAPTNLKDIGSVMNEVVIPALDGEFGTNYSVMYVFNDGKVTRFHEDYDCGY